MTLLTRAHKIYFAVVGLLAVWVGFWGYFIPDRVDKAIPWLVPPLHARFLGSMYLSGAAFMLGDLARRYAEVRVVVPAIAIWTGMLFIVSLFHLGEFDYSRVQVWIWFAAYLIYPLIAVWLTWRHRGEHEPLAGPELPRWARSYVLAQGIVVTLLALALLLVPNLMLAAWPWKITPLLAQLYSAPFLSYGLSSLILGRQQTWSEIRVAVIATLVFVAGVLLASIIHRELFVAMGPAAVLWFGGFAVATAMLGTLSAHSIRSGKSPA